MRKGWKKGISLALCAGMAVSMAACGSKEESAGKGDTSKKDTYKVLYVSRNQADTFAARFRL